MDKEDKKVVREEHRKQEEIHVKKSTLCANSRFDYEKIVYPVLGLIPCTYKEELEEILFCYDMTGMKPAEELLKESRENQFRFLINFMKLEKLCSNYHIKFTLENIYYDENFIPYVKFRDVYGKEEVYKEEDFLFFYKTFIGGILSKKYTVGNLQESGLELLKGEEGFREFYEAKSSFLLAEILRDKRNKFIENENRTMKRVKKNSYIMSTVLSVISSVGFVIAVGILIYMGWKVVPFQKKTIQANEAYIALDYVSCIDSVRDIEPEEMDVNTKYILAVSYAKSESLKPEEIQDIISKLSLSSNEKELEYWIYLGRLEAQKAQNLAKALSDDKLLMYAYMKELYSLEGDTTIEGEDKAARISQLEGFINALGEKYLKQEAVEETTKETESPQELETEMKQPDTQTIPQPLETPVTEGQSDTLESDTSVSQEEQ
jgi:type VII secretion protein EssB